MNFFIWFGFLAVCFGITHGYGDCGRCDPNAHCEVDKCVCLEGFKGNGTTCVKETSECDTCSPEAKCIDNHCRCNDGYDGNGTVCRKACTKNTTCPGDARCVNGTCVKQDCQLNCTDNARCVNDKCQCNCGFKQDGDKCVDAETMCKHCPQLSSCENVEKDCRCKSGFVLDGSCCLRNQAVAGGTFTEALLSMIKSDDRTSRYRNRLLDGYNAAYKMPARNKFTNMHHTNASRVEAQTSPTVNDSVHCNPENRESICKYSIENKMANNETNLLSSISNQTTNLNNTFLNESASTVSPHEMNNTTVNTTDGIASEVADQNLQSKSNDDKQTTTLNNATTTMPSPTSPPGTITPTSPPTAAATATTLTTAAAAVATNTTTATAIMTTKSTVTTTKRITKATGFVPSYPTPKLPPAPPLSLQAPSLTVQLSNPLNLSSEDHFLHEDVPKMMGMEPTQNPDLPQLEVGPVEVVNENASTYNEDIPNLLPINSDDVAVHHHTIDFTGPDSSQIVDSHEEPVLNKSITLHPIDTHTPSQTIAFEPPQPGAELHKRLSSHKTIHEQELFHPSSLFANPHPEDPSEVLIQSIPHKHNYQLHASSRNVHNDKRSSSKKHGGQKREKFAFVKASHKT